MFNLENYEDVDTRIHNFYEAYPMGSIVTQLITHDEEKGLVVFMAEAFRVTDDPLAARGYARGVRKDRGVDRDFWFENCETSAIGRCLANLGLSARGKRASSLEMAKVNDAKASPAPIRVRTEAQKEFLSATNKESEIIWDTTIEPPADVESAFENAVDLVQQTLSAEPVPTCKHGARVLREGTGKNGPYRGWTCSLPMKRKAEQCKSIWMIVDASGKWSFRLEDEDLIAG
jgi:hypothetical protein